MTEIEEMIIRIPGIGKEEGRRLGEEVVQILARRLSTDLRRLNIGSLDLRLTFPAGAGRDRWAGLIAEAIVKNINNA